MYGKCHADAGVDDAVERGEDAGCDRGHGDSPVE
jgi:hypothetical protein